MRVYDVGLYDEKSEIYKRINVVLEPYPHIVLGEGGHKRATWIPLGKKDADVIMDWVTEKRCLDEGLENVCTGERQIQDVGIITLKDANKQPTGKFIIVAPHPYYQQDRVLVLWRVKSGFRGSANITAGDGVTVIASDKAWHSGRGNLGETAEMLAILEPGQGLYAYRSGRHIQTTKATLSYDGKNIFVTFGGDELEAAIANEVEGEYV